jgi:threonine/homoserine/homoserine lactone efflux protein
VGYYLAGAALLTWIGLMMTRETSEGQLDDVLG